jgi:uncharacterized protein YdeI (YjbR/CyaY-like superfamily)
LPNARFFADRRALREWFVQNHATASELWIGYYKKGVDARAVTYAEAVEEALCFGWIDGQIRSLDARRYTNRYTPRKPRSRWSAVNLRKVEELRKAGRMHPAGIAARDRGQPAGYLFEQAARSLARDLESRFRSDERAWSGFQAQPPGYRATGVKWVMSAVRPETRVRRLRALMAVSRRKGRIDPLQPTESKKRTGR